jgi:2-keto-4-pentenoate hydratase/2-oxohepta-3-ene-1,7-dioic acid hydratase in catechol pathway
VLRWAAVRWVALAPTGELGLVVGDAVYVLDSDARLLSLLRAGGRHALEAAAAEARDRPARVAALASSPLAAPLPHPPSIRDFYAFEDHVRTARRRRGLDMEPRWYELPVFYFSNPHTVLGPEATVTPPSGTSELDFELEVAAVVGSGEGEIAGFMIMNDWSARDLQRDEMAVGLGPAKGKDFATSLGPLFVSADELEPFRRGKAFALAMRAAVNGRPYSEGSLADLYWSFEEMVAYAARDARVVPGDVIGSGTCGSGCILELSLVHGHETFPWLQRGDRVELTVDELGTLVNTIA